jgi:hypothetical protein
MQVPCDIWEYHTKSNSTRSNPFFILVHATYQRKAHPPGYLKDTFLSSMCEPSSSCQFQGSLQAKEIPKRLLLPFNLRRQGQEKWGRAPTWISEGHVSQFDVPLHSLQLLPAQVLGVDRGHPVNHLEDLEGGVATLRKVLQVGHGLAERPGGRYKRLGMSEVIANAGVKYSR